MPGIPIAWDVWAGRACAAVRRAAVVCRTVQEELLETRRVGMQIKDDRSPVTVADYASQAIIAALLREWTPDIPLVAEEGSESLRPDTPENQSLRKEIYRLVHQVEPDLFPTSGDESRDFERLYEALDWGAREPHGRRFWTLDPIDGTKGFLRGEHYAIALALIEEGNPCLGVVGCPGLIWDGPPAVSGVLGLAAAGEGAWEGPLFDTPTPETLPDHPLSVGTSADPAQVRFCEAVESGHSAHGVSADVASRLGTSVPPLRLDSQAKYLVVARGDADLYLRVSPKAGYAEHIWDHAAGMLLVSCAGGEVTDVLGRPLDFRHGRRLPANHGLIASNGRIHEQVLRIFQDLHAEAANVNA